MWNCLRSLISDKQANNSYEIIFDGKAISNNQLICENFNTFFVDTIITLNNQIPRNNKAVTNPLNNTGHSKFRFNLVNVDTVVNAVKQISKKQNNSELLNSRVWFDAMDYVGYFLSKIINQSLGKVQQFTQSQKSETQYWHPNTDRSTQWRLMRK